MDAERKLTAEEQEQPKKKSEGLVAELYSLLHDFAYILVVVTILFVFAVRFVGVDGNSMFPTLHNRDYMLLASNFWNTNYEQGDIVVITVPGLFDSNPIVKRIIATEGMEVDIDFETGRVYVDGKVLDEPYIFEPTHLNYQLGMDYPLTVPKGSVFVMGDNRNHSTDSRYSPLGTVDTRRIMGKVFCLAMPGVDTDELGNITGGRDFSRIGPVK
ncbi:MAG: signal peptidase I [Oscillospiraceae bacterium]|nr:signal peptidase I [Oscillospiraceae bacterium]